MQLQDIIKNTRHKTLYLLAQILQKLIILNGLLPLRENIQKQALSRILMESIMLRDLLKIDQLLFMRTLTQFDLLMLQLTYMQNFNTKTSQLSDLILRSFYFLSQTIILSLIDVTLLLFYNYLCKIINGELYE